MKKTNLAIFLSGTGSNFKSISEACLKPDYPARIKLVICDRDCNGYNISKKLQYKTILIKHLNDQFAFENKVTILYAMGMEISRCLKAAKEFKK